MPGAAVRPEVAAFAAAMETELRANARKGHWGNCDVGYLRRRLAQEVKELREAIDRGEPASRILSEAADVANFAMMIADVYEEPTR